MLLKNMFFIHFILILVMVYSTNLDFVKYVLTDLNVFVLPCYDLIFWIHCSPKVFSCCLCFNTQLNILYLMTIYTCRLFM